MKDFADLDDAGRRLAALPALEALVDHAVVAVVPNGVPAGTAVADRLGKLASGAIRREVDGAPVFEILGQPGPRVVVVDDGVETGTAAMALGSALRAAGAERLVLAVPVCPREIEPLLRGIYDEVIAVVRPLARRSRQWHYERFEPLEQGQALLLLDRARDSRG
jgi:predicted phosphoribosyltransferase